MRDIVVIGLIIVCIVATLRKPAWGGLAWVFVSVSSFHQQGYATLGLPVASAIGGCMILSILAHSKEFRLDWYPPLKWFAALTIWMTITYLASPSLEENFEMWDKVMKINLFMFLVAGVILTRKDVDNMIWIIVLALAVTGAKGGLFTLATGGAYRVWGPGGFIGGNNEFAVALVMTIPLMHYLRTVTTHPRVRQGLLAAMVLCAIAAIGSHSRGALLAICAMGLILIAKSKQRGGLILAAVVLIPLVLAVMPEEWFARMDTIKNYEEDRSAMGRLNAWTMAFNLALHRPFGSSFENVKVEYFAEYGLDTEYIQGPHSIYFQMLGQHGFIGLWLFLAVGVSTWRSANRIIAACDKRLESDAQDIMFAQMIKASLLGFAVGGAFLALAYFDVPYYLMLATGKLAQLKVEERLLKQAKPLARR